ncbi:hypothetical protein Hanom_Chr01g00044631 [Helianthus anomalus]
MTYLHLSSSSPSPSYRLLSLKSSLIPSHSLSCHHHHRHRPPPSRHYKQDQKKNHGSNKVVKFDFDGANGLWVFMLL